MRACAPFARDPWGRPRGLAIVTWVYIAWSIVPVLMAIRFAFNEGRSRSSFQGWSLRWFTEDPNLSVLHDPTLSDALVHSLELAALAMLIATPLGVGLALGLQRWRGRGSGTANVLTLLPLVTPELVFAVGLFLLFTTAFKFDRARHDGAGDRARHVLALVRRRDRARATGDDRDRPRGGRGRPRGAAVGRRAARAAAAAAAGDRGERADRLRAVDRRLRRQPVPRLGRRHDDRPDADLRAGACRADARAERARDDHARGHAARARARVPRLQDRRRAAPARGGSAIGQLASLDASIDAGGTK